MDVTIEVCSRTRRTILSMIKRASLNFHDLLRWRFIAFALLLPFIASASDYYWVGNSGNWTDPQHWSSTSGGNGGFGVPGANDNVYFDANSFTASGIVQVPNQVEVKSFFGDNMDESVRFDGPALSHFTVSGDFFLSSNVQFELKGILQFSGKGNHVIAVFDPQITANILFDGKGSWQLNNHLGTQSGNTITIKQGSLFTNGFGIYTGSLITTGTDKIVLDLTGSKVFIDKSLDLETAQNLNANLTGTRFVLNPVIAQKDIKEGKANPDNMELRATCGNLTVTLAVTSDYNGEDVSCNGACDGEITVTATSVGGGPYSYQFNDNLGPWTSQTVYPGLCADSYTVCVTDSSDQLLPGIYNVCCDNIDVDPVPIIVLNVLGVINPSCPDSCDGQAVVSVSGGTGTLTVLWDNGQLGTFPDSLCVGINGVTITDDNGCLATDSVVILTPPPIIPNVTVIDASCNGVCNGSAFATPSGGNGAPWTYDWGPDPITGDGTDTVTGLCASPPTYTLTVTDMAGCPQSTTFTVIEPPPLVVTVDNVTDNVCFVDCLGEITVTASAGTTPYTYEWFDCSTGLPIGQTGATATGLCNGDYYVEVTDAGGCVQSIGCQTISSPPALTVSTTINNHVSCFGLCDGSITAFPAGGTGAGTYSYQWFDCNTGLPFGGTGQTINSLCGGSYYVEVTDGNGCTVQSAPCDSIEEPAAIVVPTVATDVTCFGTCNGQIVASPAGGVTPYTIDWQTCTGTSIGQSTTTATNLCPGEYQVEITDANGCVQVSVCDTITEPTEITFNAAVTDVSCNGLCDGEVVGNPTGGVTPYSLSWIECGVGPIGQTSDPATGLCPGDYQLEVTDANGCVVTSGCETVNEPPPLTSNVSSTPISCGGVCDGTVTATPAGGVSPYTYSWIDCGTGIPIGQTGQTATGLCPGDYQAIVTDANGCTVTTSCVTLTDPAILTVTASTTDELCNSDCSGTATAAPVGGTSPYTYEWIDCSTGLPIGQTTVTATGLCAGDYQVIVTDDRGCIETSTCETVGSPPSLTESISGNDISCFGLCDGDATVVPGGGTTPYSIDWLDCATSNPIGQTGTTATALCAGDYQAEITDANGCVLLSACQTIVEPGLLTGNLTPQDISCFGLCDGQITSAVSGGITPYSYQWIDCGTGLPMAGETNPNLTGLCAGDYQLEITDANGCQITEACETINEPAGITINIDGFTDATCGGACDGTIDITVTGGTTPYSYDWTDCFTGIPIGNTNEDPTGLCAGTYCVVVTDASGCPLTSASVQISDMNAPTVTLTPVDATCNGNCDGSATTVIVGGVTPYTYEWFDSTPVVIGSSDNIGGLCAGNYSFVVTDDNGCAAAPELFTINDSPALTATTDSTEVSCFGLCDGTATVTVGGGATPYTYSWTPAPCGSAANIPTITASTGTWDVTIIDAQGCQLDTFVVITGPQPISTSLSGNDPSCNGGCDGDVTVVATDGVSPYTYVWIDCGTGLPIGQTGVTATGLCAGDYQVEVTDANGCTTTSLCFTLNDPPALTASITVAANNLCNGDCNGAINSIVSGGTSPYTYNWIDCGTGLPIGQSGVNAINLCVGDYQLEVTDANGCVFTTPCESIIDNPPFDVTMTTADVACNGDCTGSATATVNSGGTSPYSYSWNTVPIQTTQTAINLCAGNYDVTITDDNGCDTTITVTINENTVITATAVATDASCNGDCDGTATVTPGGGVTPYSVTWYDAITGLPIGQTTTTATGLCAGDYYAEILDGAGCLGISNTVTVNEPAPLSIVPVSTTMASCGLCDGSATITVSGGTTPYSVQWFDTGGAPLGTGLTQGGLCAGINSVTVTDANGCTDLFVVTISNPGGEQITMTVTPTTCIGDCDGTASFTYDLGSCQDGPCTVQWYDEFLNPLGTGSSEIGLCAGVYVVEVTNASNCITTLQDTVIEPTQIIPNEVVTNASCGGTCDGEILINPIGGVSPYTYSWSPAPPIGDGTNNGQALCAGTYDITISDANACDTVLSITITEPTPVDATNITSTNIDCFGANDGTATVFPSGGTSPYTYDWLNCSSGLPIGQTGQAATGLGPGDYQVAVTDANGCTMISPCVTITEAAELLGSISSTNVVCNGDCNGTASVSLMGGTSPFTYQWYLDGAPIAGAVADNVANLCAGDVTVEVTDVNNCMVTIGPVTITEPAAFDLTVAPTDVSCNGMCDGSVAVTVNAGGFSPYSYTWSPAPGGGAGTPNPIAMCPDNYQLILADAQGCDTTLTVTINEPDILYAGLQVTDATCSASCNGEILSNTSGGTTPYSYDWGPDPITGDGTNNATNLCGGTYALTIIDANGCQVDTSETITVPNVLSATVTTNDATCGACDGSASVVGGGGTAPYTYQWFDTGGAPLGTAPFQSGLCSGVNIVEVTDANGCATNFIVGISDIGAEEITASSIDATCFGDCDGEVSFVYDLGSCQDPPCTGGDWYNNVPVIIGTGTPVTNLCGGDYAVEITNNSGCTSVEVVTVNEPAEFQDNAVIVDASCGGSCDGTITLNVTGGTGAYTYAWAPAPCGGGAGTPSVTVSAGTYTCLVTDANLCDTLFTFVVADPSGLTATTTPTNTSCNGACDGEITVIANGGTPPYNYQWIDCAAGPMAGETGVTLSNLCPGDYQVEVTDAAGCVFTTTCEPIIDAPTLNVVTNDTDVSCNGACDGTIDAVITGGLSPYITNWIDCNTLLIVGTGTTISGLCPGDYQAQVTDAAGCVFTTACVSITENPILYANVTITDATCNAVCDGDALAAPTGGDGSYSYDWGPDPIVGDGTPNATNLCVGNYTLTVTDGNTCFVDTTFEVFEPLGMTATFTTIPASCTMADGSATVTISGGTSPYTYQWYDGGGTPLGTLPTQGSLAAGNYTVDVTDANGCMQTFNVSVSNFNGPVITINSVTNVSCFGDCDGAIDITASAGTSPYTYLWNPAPPQTTEDLTGVCAGTYQVEVTDALGCISFTDTTILAPTEITATTTVVDATCGVCDGTASVTPSGGSGVYTYLWSDGLAQTTQTATGLCAGVYDVLVTDDTGCSQTFSVSVSNTTVPTLTVNENPASCYNVCDGSADVTPSGGTSPYSYYWLHDGSTANSAAGLCEGQYFVEVTDAAGCVVVQEINIVAPSEITDSTYIVPATCGLADGQITITPSGGVPGYTYVWCHGPTTPTVTGLAEGFYCVTVTDATGCSETFDFTVPGATAPALSVTSTDVTCDAVCDGTADVIITGGTSPYTTTWLDAAGAPLVPPQTGTSATGLCAGDYTAEVVDAAGCTAYINVTIATPTAITLSLPFVQDASCGGTCDGAVTAIANGGTLPYTYSWTIVPDPAAASAINVCAGTYDVTVTDANGCSQTQQVTINEPTAVAVTFDNVVDALCESQCDGSIDITASGGTSPYTYSWTGPNGFTSTNEDLTALCPGDHIITITDDNGCTVEDTATVGASIIITANAGNDTTVCENTCVELIGVGTGSPTLNVQWQDSTGTMLAANDSLNVCPGVGVTQYIFCADDGTCMDCDTMLVTVSPLPVVDAGQDEIVPAGAEITLGGSPTGPTGSSYSWSPTYGMNVGDSIVSNPTITVDDTTIVFYVTVVTADGCVGIDSVIITGLPEIIFPNGITPNGDGLNETWIIDYIEEFPDNVVEIYNRWGELLFREGPYLNSWDGTFQGKPLPVGTYYYVIDLNHPDFPEVYTGPITIMR